jgi:hypothetical protein
MSLYHASVPVFLQMLKALDGVLSKAEANAVERKIDPAVFLAARLAPDMHPLPNQIQLASDQVKGSVSRLTGREVPRFEDNEVTFDDLHARIAKTRDYVKTFSEADFDGSAERQITMKLGSRELSFVGQQYLYNFVLPNFYFHVTTAYNILRHNGVPLTKANFMGA